MSPLTRRLPIVAALPLLAASAHAQSVQRMSVTLTPEGNAAAIRTVRVEQTLPDLRGRAGAPLLQVPTRITLTPGQPYDADDIVATDDQGPLPLTMRTDPDDRAIPVQWRTFTPSRDTVGSVRLRYRATVTQALAPRDPGPSYDLRGLSGGFGGAFFSFLLLPRDAQQHDLSLHWDLSGLPPGGRGMTTRGEGDVAGRFDLGDLGTLFLLGGRMGAFSSPDGLFRSYWIGRPPFDPEAAARWSARSFAMQRAFFRDSQTTPYYLLMRPFPLPRDGGGATRGGFMLEYGVGRLSDAARRFMFTHEIIHHFIGMLEGDASRLAWFGEGLAEYYKVRLPIRHGLADLPATAAEIGVMTNAYYMSPLVAASYEQAANARWAGGEAQSIPYNRGFLYFANLDALVRAHSGDRRSLDDLVLAMLESRRAGRGYSEAQWRALLQAELGQAGIDDFENMQRGGLIVPPNNAFGPCLERRQRRVHRPVLGFAENALLVEPHVVRRLAPDSAAAAAGLREGDRIVSFTGARPRIAHSASNLRLDPQLRLVVERGGRRETIAFSTQGPLVDEYHWVPRQRAARGNCSF